MVVVVVMGMVVVVVVVMRDGRGREVGFCSGWE